MESSFVISPFEQKVVSKMGFRPENVTFYILFTDGDDKGKMGTSVLKSRFLHNSFVSKRFEFPKCIQLKLAFQGRY